MTVRSVINKFSWEKIHCVCREVSSVFQYPGSESQLRNLPGIYSLANNCSLVQLHLPVSSNNPSTFMDRSWGPIRFYLEGYLIYVNCYSFLIFSLFENLVYAYVFLIKSTPLPRPPISPPRSSPPNYIFYFIFLTYKSPISAITWASLASNS